MKVEKHCSERGHFHRAEMLVLNVMKKKDCYGYEIMKILEKKSDGEFILKEPTLYSVLKRLEKENYITSYWGDETSGGRRKYYSMTKEGKKHFQNLVNHWERAKAINDKLLK